MSSHLRAPEIDRLVDELNRRPGQSDPDAAGAEATGSVDAAGPAGPAGQPGAPPGAPGGLRLPAALPPVFRIDGRLRRGDSDPLDAEDIARMFQAQLASHA